MNVLELLGELNQLSQLVLTYQEYIITREIEQVKEPDKADMKTLESLSEFERCANVVISDIRYYINGGKK